MSTAPIFTALAQGIEGLQTALSRAGQGHHDLRLLIPAKLGERIEAELCTASPEIWLPFANGIEIHADGHLKQIRICEGMLVGWKLGMFSERTGNGQSPSAHGHGV